MSAVSLTRIVRRSRVSFLEQLYCFIGSSTSIYYRERFLRFRIHLPPKDGNHRRGFLRILMFKIQALTHSKRAQRRKSGAAR